MNGNLSDDEIIIRKKLVSWKSERFDENFLISVLKRNHQLRKTVQLHI